jgi:hypothetical protein
LRRVAACSIRELCACRAAALWTAVRVASIFFLVGVAASPAAADITTGQVAHYKADNSVDDAVGSNDATLENGATYRTPGQIGPAAFEVDGTNDQVLLPANLGTDGVGALTIAFWKYTDTVADFETFYSKFTDVNNRLELGHGGATGGAFGSNDAQFVMAIGGTTYYTATSGNFLTTGAWQHIVWVFDGSGVGNDGRSKIYIDGTLRAGTHSGTWPTTVYSNNSVASYLARRGATGAVPMDGGLDDVRFYTRALSAGDVTELYNFRDISAVVNLNGNLDLHLNGNLQ